MKLEDGQEAPGTGLSEEPGDSLLLEGSYTKKLGESGTQGVPQLPWRSVLPKDGKMHMMVN
jgi:hypothetical protein